jgi:exopolysaccharide biosynthesis WecB/TagA/CpsF family protein
MISARADVDGWRVNIKSQEDAIRAVSDAASRGQSSTFFTLNLDHLVKLRTDSKFRDAYREATFVSADGAPIVHIGRRTCKDLQLTTGSDLMLPLCMAAAEANHSVFLFGSSDSVLKSTVEVLKAATGGRLKIAGAVAPPYGFDAEGELADRYIKDIRQSGCRLCFVLLGAPKQELFAARAMRRGVNCSFICVGAAADFLSGRIVRAPSVFQRLGLEWLWRVAREPRRLGPRYAKCAVLLADIEWRRRFGAAAARNGTHQTD